MTADGLSRRLVGGALLGALVAPGSLAAPGAAWSQETQIDEFRADQTTDRVHRSTVPVFINGQGPLRFAVDTAASASVVAGDLVERLGIAPAGELDMHTVIGLERVPAVRARTLSSGSLSVGEARMAVGTRPGLIGLDGLLGLDLLAEQRLIMRFRGQGRSSINRSRPDPDQFLGVVRPRVRFQPPQGGGAELMVVNALVRGQAVQAVVDTGAQVTLINPALAEAASARPFQSRAASSGNALVQSPTGRAALAQAMVVSAVHFDELVLDRLAVLMGDFHIFRLLGLENTPAMLMGVDVLGVFERVVIDLKRGEIIMDV
ncbi:MAG: pepsin/retropepsin-like aspartic protease family protein [Brevundimonas sp.]|uniref:pepsin/retropepsin-like aspartic protease family protein n=1 Tax=Brevundimonas sp. TaxID=1871086 RepID=UPI0026153C9A|nr:pepsin/retropepsin-like aspartic protease family protein [Brevundimonas sp.]MDI6624187.1 pepsin/retropepsin-like aspartic protease family protein [Brevundimonas sp.]MDQ7811628.1 pepsin/retropepsin-like aspartic protease family protein [Brevundimonas sp.]